MLQLAYRFMVFHVFHTRTLDIILSKQVAAFLRKIVEMMIMGEIGIDTVIHSWTVFKLRVGPLLLPFPNDKF